jgi:hypothetical protein
MGWTFQAKPHHVKEYLDGGFRDGVTVLKSALKIDTYYAALQHDGVVSATVCLIRYVPGDDPYNFGTKWIDEDCGPVESECPKGILELLTPTDSEWANQWRERCWHNVRCREAVVRLKVGETFDAVNPIRFTNGESYQRFTLIRRDRSQLILRPEGASFQVRMARGPAARNIKITTEQEA